MTGFAGRRPIVVWATHLSMAALVILWLIPTVGLLVSSFRTVEQISTTGWWRALLPTQQNLTLRTAPKESQIEIDGVFVISGNLFSEASQIPRTVTAFGVSSRDVSAFAPGDIATFRNGADITVTETGDYRMTHVEPFDGARGVRVFVTATVPPEFTTQNYSFVLFSDGPRESMGQAFLNTLTVAIPATVIPILMAAFAAYALAWMEFPGRAILVASIVALLVVPLQLALIPLLSLHNTIGIGKGYLGAWLAHTGFGLPLAVYLLRNYMMGLPKEVIESAKVDGASDFQIFVKIVLPLSFPALASFAIFQFLWTWNDLLVAMVFLIDARGETTVMTRQIVELLGTEGGNWEVLATAAFVSIAVPLLVFFSLQRYLVRGLLAGSVK